MFESTESKRHRVREPETICQPSCNSILLSIGKLTIPRFARFARERLKGKQAKETGRFASALSPRET